MASPTQWTWVWVSSGSWWLTGKPGVLQSMVLQRVRDNWATELNWTELASLCCYLREAKSVLQHNCCYWNHKSMCLAQNETHEDWTVEFGRGKGLLQMHTRSRVAHALRSPKLLRAFLILNQSAVPWTVLTVTSWPAYRFLRRQVRWSAIPVFWRIFHCLLWST